MEWISVKDRRPHHQRKIIITNGKWVDVTEEHGMDDNDEYYFNNGTGKVESVSHWMPLPEPPKE
jgi:hypothetical protein